MLSTYAAYGRQTSPTSILKWQWLALYALLASSIYNSHGALLCHRKLLPLHIGRMSP
jgi:hypothetical protein